MAAAAGVIGAKRVVGRIDARDSVAFGGFGAEATANCGRGRGRGAAADFTVGLLEAALGASFRLFLAVLGAAGLADLSGLILSVLVLSTVMALADFSSGLASVGVTPNRLTDASATIVHPAPHSKSGRRKLRKFIPSSPAAVLRRTRKNFCSGSGRS